MRPVQQHLHAAAAGKAAEGHFLDPAVDLQVGAAGIDDGHMPVFLQPLYCTDGGIGDDLRGGINDGSVNVKKDNHFSPL